MDDNMAVAPAFAADFESIPDALIDVCLADDVHLIDTFLQQGGLQHIDATGKHDRTPLMMSAAWNASRAVELLVRRGANVHLKDPDGTTALHLAAENNAKQSVQALVHAGALLDDQNAWGLTALHLAAGGGHVACAKELLVAGARLDLTTVDDGDTALDLALRDGHQSTVLLLRGWDPQWSSRLCRHRLEPAMQTWTQAHVADFLRSHAMSQYVPQFLAHNIDGLALSEMTDTTLESKLKMDRPKHRVRLLEAIMFTQLHSTANHAHLPPEGATHPANTDATKSTVAPLPPVSPPRRPWPTSPSPYLAPPWFD
ncbi:hypothetical protein H310_08915 [Aphanomyces invadans]|uniref:SAM domain-containing protein n=1 Tax=Aphanomyces invadans TaxID=157072 RepID=A0A024TXV3_9STRA|nr:hypothetical protein H310_08915 [Aphanomyces invadans]ETV98187.1 hypothetical protein H310_08915 [Aphanomyces invadans]|eukprot:XP_008873062.1 hypothetical protein H310_08915 [Aphanomyces invadans]